MKENVLFIALNEFNESLLQEKVKEISLPNIETMLCFFRSETFTEDTYESDRLEPWVQWVSIHTGKSSQEHKIQHLGDVPDLCAPQLWECLSERGITSGIWGPMNAARRNSSNCLFFLPDPWTASEWAYPVELNAVLDLFRYICKNYVQKSHFLLLKKLGPFFSHLHEKDLTKCWLKELPALIQKSFQLGAEPWIGFAEFLFASLFLAYRNIHRPAFSLIFLNHLAHLQHHHWHPNSPHLAYGLKNLDRILGMLFAEGGTVIVANALSQQNTREDPPWILYRPYDHTSFLKAIGIACERVEPHMTHDAHLFFSSVEECERGEKILQEIAISDQKLFHVESYPRDPKKLFYRIAFTDFLEPKAQFHSQGKSFPFFQFFKPIVRRTGKHIPQGTLYCNRPGIAPRLANRDIFHAILHFT